MNLVEINVLKDWISQQSEFNKNDLLVTINTSKIVPYTDLIEWHEIQKIITNSQNSIKENGINPFCTSKGILNWTYQSTEINTPIFIIPTNFRIDKVRKVVEIQPLEEEKIINPFLVKKLEQLFQINLLPTTDDSELFEKLRTYGLTSIEEEKSYLGNFHHHRFAILKDLETIVEQNQLSENLIHYIAGTKPNIQRIELPKSSILSYDTDHRDAFHLIEEENCIIQGPPGTGKSQLLTNVVAKSMAIQQTQLVVSEKKSALEVIQKRLASRNLDQFAILVNDGINTHEFLDSLKTTWEALENYPLTDQKEISTYKALSDNLQFTLDILAQQTLIGGTTFSHFNKLKSTVNLTQFKYLSDVPSIPEFENTLGIVKEFYNLGLNRIISKIRFPYLKEENLNQLSEQIEIIRNASKNLKRILPTITPAGIEDIQFKTVILQLFENEIARKYLNILRPNSKSQIQFKKQYEKYKELQLIISSKEKHLTHWNILPGSIELESLLEQFENKSIFKRFKRNKRWKKLSALPLEKASAAISELIAYRKLEENLNLVEQKLSALGIDDLSELPQINASIGLFTEEKWMLFEEITPEIKLDLLQFTTSTNQAKNILKFVLNLDEEQPIDNQIDEIEASLHHLIELKTELEKLTVEIYKVIARCANFENYTQNIIGTYQSKFSSHYPTLSNFSIEELKPKLDQILLEEKKDQQLFAQQIWAKIKRQFDNYHTLLNTPSSKLNEEHKQLKNVLKKGKAILVKEFTKSKQHPTIHELLSTDAAIWIRLLKPVWLTNPVQLAKTHEITCEPFDLCIIDEASQIVVENAVGAIQRSKRIVIAGDQQQMQPSSYFQARQNEVISVLQHASYQFKNVQLRHHYRSKHAPLIEFSNIHFYESKLQVYPSYPIQTNCITRHFCEDGKFINRTNVPEAIKVSQLISQAINQHKTIGIVAFSQEQLEEIWKQLDSISKLQLTSLIDENRAFFKPLEKVQGDECEHLIISLGYAKNEQEQFQQRFGPLNQENGRNRLNVLLSRASEKIDFVCSIKSSDLKWSTNSTIELLFKWLHQLEIQKEQSKTISLPKNINMVCSSNKIIVTDTLTHFNEALELVTLYSMLNSRGWEIVFK